MRSGQRSAERLAPLDLHPRDVGLLRAVAGLGFLLSSSSPNGSVWRRVGYGSRRQSRPARGAGAETHPGERWAYELHLTDAGIALLGKLACIGADYEAELSAPLEPDERRTLVRLLRRFAEAQQLPLDVHPGLAREGPQPTPERGDRADGAYTTTGAA